ncbi:MAG: hypothetical protein H6837_18420 [Planctomycetes bacterium]|nr:hypothetical protein [Planctomycetota bacterium]
MRAPGWPALAATILLGACRGAEFRWPTSAARLAPALRFSDPAAWRVHDGGELELWAPSHYSPPVRAPLGMALLDGFEFGDFELELDVMQTGREYGHRDLCVFFGVQSRTRFYYVHLASRADPHAHNVFRVFDAPRTRCASFTTPGVDWGRQQWHRVKVTRRLAEGEIRVYFDDMTMPVMTATDRTLGVGLIGFGSFDDTGRFRNVVLRGAGRRSTLRVF